MPALHRLFPVAGRCPRERRRDSSACSLRVFGRRRVHPALYQLTQDRRGLSLVKKPSGECLFLEGGNCSVQPVKPSRVATFRTSEDFLASRRPATPNPTPSMRNGMSHLSPRRRAGRKSMSEPILRLSDVAVDWNKVFDWADSSLITHGAFAPSPKHLRKCNCFSREEMVVSPYLRNPNAYVILCRPWALVVFTQ